MSAREAVPSQLDILDAWKPEIKQQEIVVQGFPASTVSETLNKFRSGEIIPPDLFNFEGRENKRNLYLKLFELAKQYLEYDVEYIGLPAAAIEWIVDNLSQYKPVNYFYGFESNRRTYKYMSLRYTDYLTNKVNRSHIFNENLFRFDRLNRNPFVDRCNFIDLDLMCHLSVDALKAIRKYLLDNAQKCNVIVNIVTSYGNGLHKTTYEKILRPVLVMVLEQDFNIKHHTFGNYRDRRIPMMYEHLVIERKGK